MTDVFRVLAHPVRRAVLDALAGGEMTVSQLHESLDVSQPLMSQHLAALRDAGLVSERREGRNAFYRAEPDGVAPVVHWVESYVERYARRYRGYWPSRLEKLKTVLKGVNQ
jgi:DNA-binding transcriptional ArsR family regulator